MCKYYKKFIFFLQKNIFLLKKFFKKKDLAVTTIGRGLLRVFSKKLFTILGVNFKVNLNKFKFGFLQRELFGTDCERAM